MLLYKQSHPNQIRFVVELRNLLALVDMLFCTADMTYFDINEFLAVVLALLNQNMNQAIVGIRLVPHIVSGTEPYLR